MEDELDGKTLPADHRLPGQDLGGDDHALQGRHPLRVTVLLADWFAAVPRGGDRAGRGRARNPDHETGARIAAVRRPVNWRAGGGEGPGTFHGPRGAVVLALAFLRKQHRRKQHRRKEAQRRGIGKATETSFCLSAPLSTGTRSDASRVWSVFYRVWGEPCPTDLLRPVRSNPRSSGASSVPGLSVKCGGRRVSSRRGQELPGSSGV